MGQEAGTRAVVLGGSIAGLFAAKVLADAYDEVQIVDRDKLVGVKGVRRFCPQSHQANGLLARGVQVMEELFPGLTQEMIDNGVPTGDLSGSCRWYARGNRLKQQHAGLTTLGVVRPMFEYFIRERVQQIPNVKFIEEHDILGLTTSADKSQVTGARVQKRGTDTDEVITADLVVDATGRGSRTPVWLEQLGYEKPFEERKKIDLGYVTQHFRLREGANGFVNDVAINQIAHDVAPRGNVFFLVEDGKVELTTYGILGDHPPTEYNALMGWLKALPVKDVYNTLRYADPVDKAMPFKFPTTLRRHYQKLRRFPEGLLVTGDAVTTFNPVYAQGMSVAALCALVLRQHLHSGAAPVPQDYFRDLATDAIDQAWEMTNQIDLSLPGVEGERTFKVKMGNWFLRRVQIAATHDGSITAEYFKTAGLVQKPEAMMRPGFALKVLWKSLFGPSKESRVQFEFPVAEGVEPAFGGEAAELPKAA
jgi:2-polyprenyl-6-methoxyphenol hydroxylase-like FAD-dependent oxidoreductase